MQNDHPRRDEVEQTLASIAGPLGPFVSIDNHLSDMDRWIDASGPGLVDTLLELASDPTWHQRYETSTPEELTGALSDALCLVSGRYPATVPDKAGPYLDNLATRLFAIDALAAAGLRAGLPWLRRLLEHGAQLKDEEIRHLAEAIADIGGSDGRALLVRLLDQSSGHALRERISELLAQSNWSVEDP